ncbi:hypothetical protein V8F63_13510 [Brevundimonas sp. LF-1]|uniref:hypothetical protein n=1 Tax=Brevundimonas sp. LF-1 TaxID=3126100 RepID=UPI0030E2C212
MTVITHNRRRSRLSTLIDQPGGVSVGTALKQARANLAEYETRSREVIEEQVSALAGMKPPPVPTRPPPLWIRPMPAPAP